MGSFAAKTKCDRLFWIALVGLLILFVFIQSKHIGQFSWDDDEGIYMAEAYLLGSGHRLYSEIFSPSPPLFIVSLRWAFVILGVSAQAARAVIIAYSTIGLLAVALIAREMKGWLAGLSAIFLLAIAPDFFLLSRVCIGDIPSISLATLAIFMALRYYHSGHRIWLAWAGLSMALALLLKLLAAFAVPFLGLIVLLRHLDPLTPGQGVPGLKEWRSIVTDLMWLGLPFLVPFAYCFLSYDPKAMYEHVVVFQLAIKDGFGLDLADNLRIIGTYLVKHIGLFTLTLYGSLTLLVKRPRLAVLVLTWVAMTMLLLIQHAPLYEHLLSPLLFPMAVLGGIAIANTWECLKVLRRNFTKRSLLMGGGGVFTLALYLFALPGVVRLDARFLSDPSQQSRHWNAAQFLQRITKPDDFVITDSLMVAFVAGRRVPPPLAEVSMGRIVAGYLPLDQLIATTQKYEVKAIAIWGERLPDGVPEYVEWVQENYRLVKFHNKEHQIYLARGVPPPPELTFDGKVIFAGVTPNNLRVGSDNKVHFTLHWSALQEMAEDYVVYLKLVNSVYHVWGEQDSRPYWDGCPTNTWYQGQVVHDQREIEVLPGTPPGIYWVEIALYDLNSGQWIGPDDGSNLRLGPVEIPRREPPPISFLDIAYPLEVDLGGKIRLLGYNIESGFRPGDNIHLTLFWQCLEPVEEDYTVFVHLVDEGSHILAQKDNPPVDGFYLTVGWEPGEIVRDQYDLIIPQDVQGDWELKVGMYNAETGQRVSAVADEEFLPDNAVVVWP